MRHAAIVLAALLATRAPARAGDPDVTFESLAELALGAEAYKPAGDCGGFFTADAPGPTAAATFYGYHHTDPWDYWGGWCVSNRTVVGADDWLRQYTSAPGTDHTLGAGGTYAIGFDDYESSIGCRVGLLGGLRGCTVRGAWFTNVTWTVEYMNENYGPDDYYELVVTAYDEALVETGHTVVDLTGVADWRWYDLDLPRVSFLGIRMSASDDWTPYYFCLDDVVVPEPATASLLAWAGLAVLGRPRRRGQP